MQHLVLKKNYTQIPYPNKPNRIRKWRNNANA
jgi:hypothetical protein